MGSVLAVNEEAIERPGMDKGRQAKQWALLLLLSLLLSGCSSAMRWAQDPPNVPSCVPDRLLTWEDFRPKAEVGRRAAETAVRFHLEAHSPPRILAVFDPKLSWVRADFAYTLNPLKIRSSEQQLRHEQLHYTISCMLAREANLSLMNGGDPKAMLILLNAVATRMNVQYDAESNHGLNREKQQEWEEAIQESLLAGPLTKPLVKTLGEDLRTNSN
jgi:hypothetical protein